MERDKLREMGFNDRSIHTLRLFIALLFKYSYSTASCQHQYPSIFSTNVMQGTGLISSLWTSILFISDIFWCKEGGGKYEGRWEKVHLSWSVLQIS